MKRYIRTLRKCHSFCYTEDRSFEVGSYTPTLDGFKVQTTKLTHSLFAANSIMTILTPPKCIDTLQPLDLSINKPMKDHLKSKFQVCYAIEIKKENSVESVKVNINLAVVKCQLDYCSLRSIGKKIRNCY